MAGETQDERIRTWVLFVVGLAFLTKYAFWTPASINPYLTTLIGGMIFGKAVLGLWKKGDR